MTLQEAFSQVESCFRQWIGDIVGVVEGVVAFDGKTVRGSKDGPNTALHMVSAYATELGVSLGQEGTVGKGNDLAAIKAGPEHENSFTLRDL